FNYEKYALFVREDITIQHSEESMKSIIAIHTNWAKDLAEKGIFINGYGLNGEGCLLELVEGEIVTKPIPYPEMAFGELYVIQAESFEAALEIGKQCPTFSIGDKIEVRELI
ncbi:MAG: YciI family protein, partial [Chitinophagales bacterium]